MIQQGSNPHAQIALIVANLVPVVGVLFFDWSLFLILFLYWVETGIVGFFNIFRIAKSQGPFPTLKGTNFEKFDEKLKKALLQDDAPSIKQIYRVIRMVLIPFFLMHYGIFNTVHVVFIVVLFAPDEFASSTFFGVEAGSFLVALAGLFASHFISYKQNYIGNEEYKHINPLQQMFKPYKRIVLLHLFIIASAFAIAPFTNHDGARYIILLFVGFKMVADIIAHRLLHKNISVV